MRNLMFVAAMLTACGEPDCGEDTAAPAPVEDADTDSDTDTDSGSDTDTDGEDTAAPE
jgi:hypothetical protein